MKLYGKTLVKKVILQEMSMKREGQHICKSEKLQYKAIHVNKNASENEGTNVDSNIV